MSTVLNTSQKSHVLHLLVHCPLQMGCWLRVTVAWPWRLCALWCWRPWSASGKAGSSLGGQDSRWSTAQCVGASANARCCTKHIAATWPITVCTLLCLGLAPLQARRSPGVHRRHGSCCHQPGSSCHLGPHSHGRKARLHPPPACLARLALAGRTRQRRLGEGCAAGSGAAGAAGCPALPAGAARGGELTAGAQEWGPPSRQSPASTLAIRHAWQAGWQLTEAGLCSGTNA